MAKHGKKYRAAAEKVDFTAAELEAVKAKAFAEGHDAGVAEAAQEAAAQTSAAFDAIAGQLKQMAAQMARHHDESIASGVAAAVAMTRKLLPALAARESAVEIEALIKDCLGRLHDEPKIVIRLHESLVEAFRQRLDDIAATAGFSGRVVAVADPRITPDGARVEWADGGVERNMQQVWQEIEAIIERFVASGATK